MKNILFTIGIICFGAGATIAQDYKGAVGLRIGGTSGISGKISLGGNHALEGIVGFWRRGFSVTALYEKYAGTGVENLSWYYGGGVHVAFASSAPYRDYWYDSPKFGNGSDQIGFGVDGIVGIEYKIPPIPVALSLDLKPFVEVTTASNFYFGLDPGLGVKFAFW